MTEYDINYFGTRKVSEKINLTYFALAESTWSEALIGLTYSPKKWLEVGLSTGIEHGTTVPRLGASILITSNHDESLFIDLEKGHGNDNYWYKVVIAKKLNDELVASITAWRSHGIGPCVKFTPKKSDFTYWIMPAYDAEAKTDRLMFGVDIKF